MTQLTPGPRNAITDVAGIKVGNAEDAVALSGVTAIIPDAPVVAAADIRGGAPGTREIAALDPSCLVDAIHGVVLAGGSVFGLEAAAGVANTLAARGVGYTFASQPLPCPVVPGAILFDLTNGGDKFWGEVPPYRDLGVIACKAADADFELGNAGAGLGAIAGNLKGGLGTASAVHGGITVGALVVVNSFGSTVDPRTGDLWAATLENGSEFGARRSPLPKGAPEIMTGSKLDRLPGTNTTIAVVATDACLTRAGAQRLAIMATDGMARAIRPVHTPFDGDTVFALASGKCGPPEVSPRLLMELGAIAADTLTRAIGRAMYHATPLAGHRSWRDTQNV